MTRIAVVVPRSDIIARLQEDGTVRLATDWQRFFDQIADICAKADKAAEDSNELSGSATLADVITELNALTAALRGE